jgi:hypothetical protein
MASNNFVTPIQQKKTATQERKCDVGVSGATVPGSRIERARNLAANCIFYMNNLIFVRLAHFKSLCRKLEN